MPIKWTAELDSILLHGVFEECNISFSKSLCAKIADRVGAAGVECTAKAVENRLYSWKKKNLSSATTATNGVVTSTPTKLTTPKTPRSRAKATPRKRKGSSDESDSGGPEGFVEDDEELVSPLVARGKRGLSNGAMKPSYAEPESEVEDGYVSMSKCMKVEPVNDDLDLSFDGAPANDLGVEDEV